MIQLYHHIRWLVTVVVLVTLPAVAQVRDTLFFSSLSRTVETIPVGNEAFSLYSYPDCDHIDQVDAPMLPVKYIRLSVPYNATNIRVTSTGFNQAQLISRRIYPAPVPLTTNDTVPDTPELVIDSAIYMTDAFWPASPAQLVGDGFYMGENRIITVAVYPMLYNPRAMKIRTYSQVRVNVIYDLGGTPANMLVRRGGDLRLQEQQSAKAMVENPHQVEGFAMPATQAFHLPAHGLLPDSVLTDTASYYYGGELYTWGDRARYLIVTTRDLAPSFKRLAALKRQKGYSVQIKCIEDILADPRVQHGDVFVNAEGDTISTINDDAGKLRQYLKLAHAYDNTQFVLMGGKDVPYRYGFNDSIQHKYYYSVPSDWYYVDLNTNWNLDNDLLYGEQSLMVNKFDFNSDLCVGRLMAEQPEQINNYTDKLLRYELNPGNGNMSYLNRALVTEGFLTGIGSLLEECYQDVFPHVSLMVQPDTLTSFPTGRAIVDSISVNKYAYLSVLGHGNPHRIGVSGKEKNNKVIFSSLATTFEKKVGNTAGSFDEIDNKYNPGIFHTNACVTMPFDTYYRSANVPYDGLNLGQSFTLGKNYGGVAYIGNTRDGFRTWTTNLEKRFVKQLALDSLSIGEAVSMSKQTNTNIYTTMTLNLMGEPELLVWTKEPSFFENVQIERTDNSILAGGVENSCGYTIIGINYGSSVRMSLVSSNSVVLNNVNPNSTVMIYRHNYLPYIAPLFLQNGRITQSQYVIANDVFAGRNVDSNRTVGDLTIASGVKYEIDAKGNVVLAGGFTVEKGAYFSVNHSDY